MRHAKNFYKTFEPFNKTDLLISIFSKKNKKKQLATLSEFP